MTETAFAELVAGTALEIRCPRCGHVEADDYEALGVNLIHGLACPACGRRFHLLVAECPVCEEETSITWPDVPDPVELRRLRCFHCDARINQDEEALRPMEPGRQD